MWTREGWLYLAVILDLHSRRVIGWAVSNRMKRDLAIRALQMAVALRQLSSDEAPENAADIEGGADGALVVRSWLDAAASEEPAKHDGAISLPGM